MAPSTDLNTWLKPLLWDARSSATPGRDAMRAAMSSSWERFERLRFLALWGALVWHFKQRKDEVRALLSAEFGGHQKVAPPDLERGKGSTEEQEQEQNPDHLSAEGSGQDRWPVSDLIVHAAAAFDHVSTWDKLVHKAPDQPVGFLALTIAWTVKSRLRRSGESRAHPRPDYPDRGNQHRVATLLDRLEGADPACGGCVEDARGWYREVVERIEQRLVQTGEVTTYTLRKLFPHHAWPPEAEAGRSLLARTLLRSIEERFPGGLEVARANKLGKQWDASAPSSPREGLERSAQHHNERESFPGWREVALWAGVASPEKPPDTGTLQRRITRLDEQVEELVQPRYSALCALLVP